MSYRGECNCGAVQVKATADPIVQLCCHCLDCQKATGKHFAEIAFFKTESLSVSGNLDSHDFTSDSGSATQREYCVECKQVVTDRSAGFPNLTGIMADVLEPPYRFNPVAHVWCKSKHSETVLEEGIKAFDEGIPARR